MISKIKKRSEKVTSPIDLLSHIIVYNEIGNYSLEDITGDKYCLYCNICYKNKYIFNDYMDKSIRNFTNDLSESLRDIMGKNVFYDIIMGQMCIHV